MKYTEIKLHHSTYLPGFDQGSSLRNVEATTDPGSPMVLRIKGPVGTVSVPWSAVSYAFEAEAAMKLRMEGCAAVAAGAQATGTGIYAHVERMQSAGQYGAGLSDQLGATANAQDAVALTPGEQLANDKAVGAQQQQSPKAAAALQPGPPQKKGGRK